MNQRGFTIVELLVVVVILGIMVAMVIPSSRRLVKTQRVREARSRLYEDIQMARQTAITRRAPVYIRFGDGVTTSNVTQYTLHVDSNNDRTMTTGEDVRTRNLPSGIALRTVALAPTDTLAFDISGILWPSHQGGMFVIQPNSSDSANIRRDTLMVSAAGMVYRP